MRIVFLCGLGSFGCLSACGYGNGGLKAVGSVTVGCFSGDVRNFVVSYGVFSGGGCIPGRSVMTVKDSVVAGTISACGKLGFDSVGNVSVVGGGKRIVKIMSRLLVSSESFSVGKLVTSAKVFRGFICKGEVFLLGSAVLKSGGVLCCKRRRIVFGSVPRGF